jgi:hypothetical protein
VVYSLLFVEYFGCQIDSVIERINQ